MVGFVGLLVGVMTIWLVLYINCGVEFVNRICVFLLFIMVLMGSCNCGKGFVEDFILLLG